MENLTKQAAKPTSTPLTALVTSTTAGSSAARATPPASATPTTIVPTPVSCNANVVTIPVPIVTQEDIYTYISVKGSLHDRTATVFGLNNDEVSALVKRFENRLTQMLNGVMINAPPMHLINTLSQLGYKVICSSGEAEIVWTMQREA